MPHVPDRHADHDLELVAAFAAEDVSGLDLERATAQLAGCSACFALAGDLRLIAQATAGLPAPRRTRDYTLTAEQAARLRPAGIRGLLATLAGARFRFAAPLGGSLAAVGLAGLLVAAMPGAFAGGAASVPAGDASGTVAASSQPAAAGAEPALSADPNAAVPAPSAAAPAEAGTDEYGTTSAQPEATLGITAQGSPVADASVEPRTSEGEGGDRRDVVAADGSRESAWAAAGSAALLLLGLLLVLARLIARRSVRTP